nr:nucleotidyl transferase [uncultured bacterium]
MIPEPQKTYLLELLVALGPSATDFVLAGAQSMKFTLAESRATRDFDFVLDVIHLREQDGHLKQILDSLDYQVVPESRNFQFEKVIPNTNEVLRIEFMAPHEFKRKKDFRVEIDKGVHARECFGGAVALQESDPYELTGQLPDGQPASITLRVTRPTALVLLKLLALDDRYRNIRGASEAEHDRQEAQTHAADVIAIMTANLELDKFRQRFYKQMQGQTDVEIRIASILKAYFHTDSAPGMLLYEEALRRNTPIDSETRIQLRNELNRAFRMIIKLLPADGQS